MKRVTLYLFVILLCAGSAGAQLDTLYAEYFTGGTTSLNWFDPWTPGNTIGVQSVTGNPSGDGWVGKVSNELSGGGVGTALAGTINLTDYEVQAQVYTTVGTGIYHTLVARWDTTGAQQFYALRTDFDA
ncbi:MAG: hypothetical protein C4524_14425, partial [Candidatus Zixiibacteriota bacterium]